MTTPEIIHPIVLSPHVTTTPHGLVAYIHLDIAKPEIQNAMGPALQEIFATIKSQNLEVTGSWFTIHYRITPEAWDFDICVPLKSSIAPSGRVHGKLLEPAQAATASYVGPYQQLHEAWPILRQWMTAQNLERASWLCEVYEIGPESGLPATQWKTQLYQPIA
jgi:effector-binding domain-containing protein